MKADTVVTLLDLRSVHIPDKSRQWYPLRCLTLFLPVSIPLHSKSLPGHHSQSSSLVTRHNRSALLTEQTTVIIFSLILIISEDCLVDCTG
jgi:hypothetical protein